jgi:hypothetical protein
MFEFILPLIINLLMILYCIFNIINKYNITYILWIISAFIPILNWMSLLTFPCYISTARNGLYENKFKLKPTKLNKFLFGYEDKTKN